ncbi:MAG TPA: hypothetical protein VND91_01750 [Candidatus Saccharimonadia bacterium]|nr:hypothetical protein [Candidatus Saccharimonadia bacterium]
MRWFAALLLVFVASANAQDGTRFRLDIGLAMNSADRGPIGVNAELGKQFEAQAAGGSPGVRLQGEIVRSTLAARGREILDVAVLVSQQSGSNWTVVADTTLKLHVGRRGEVSIESADGAEAVAITALATRL